MSPFKFPVINSLLHSELRLKIMVALDSLEITTLKEAGYIEVSKTGIGRFSHTVCHITRKGHDSLLAYEQGLRQMFEQRVPDKEEGAKKVGK